MSAMTTKDPVIDALEAPGYVVRCMILDAAKMFFRTVGREAVTMYLTPGMEALLDADIRREGLGEPVRARGQLMGFEIVFDSSDFKLE